MDRGSLPVRAGGSTGESVMSLKNGSRHGRQVVFFHDRGYSLASLLERRDTLEGLVLMDTLGDIPG